jgi:hypothetical protein
LVRAITAAIGVSSGRRSLLLQHKAIRDASFT